MCGLCGEIRFDGQVDLAANQKMAGTLHRRGPDAGGFFAQHNIALGHRRIALLHAPESLMFSHLERIGYEEALRAAGIGFDPDLCVEAAMTEEGGAEHAHVDNRQVGIDFAADWLNANL